MPRAANDVMQSILFSAVLDSIAALKRASGGLPNQLLRDVQAIHSNVTFADLPKELQDAIFKAGKEAGDFGRQLESSEEVTKLDALEKAGKLKRVPFEERDAMKKLADPVMATYAKEIGAEGIFEKINVA